MQSFIMRYREPGLFFTNRLNVFHIFLNSLEIRVYFFQGSAPFFECHVYKET